MMVGPQSSLDKALVVGTSGDWSSSASSKSPCPRDSLVVARSTLQKKTTKTHTQDAQQYGPSHPKSPKHLWRKCEFWNPFKHFATGECECGVQTPILPRYEKKHKQECFRQTLGPKTFKSYQRFSGLSYIYMFQAV